MKTLFYTSLEFFRVLLLSCCKNLCNKIQLNSRGRKLKTAKGHSHKRGHVYLLNRLFYNKSYCDLSLCKRGVWPNTSLQFRFLKTVRTHGLRRKRMVYKWQIIQFELPIAEGNKGTFGRIFSFPNTETQKVGRIKSVWEQTSNFI